MSIVDLDPRYMLYAPPLPSNNFNNFKTVKN